MRGLGVGVPGGGVPPLQDGTLKGQSHCSVSYFWKREFYDQHSQD